MMFLCNLRRWRLFAPFQFSHRSKNFVSVGRQTVENRRSIMFWRRTTIFWHRTTSFWHRPGKLCRQSSWNGCRDGQRFWLSRFFGFGYGGGREEGQKWSEEVHLHPLHGHVQKPSNMEANISLANCEAYCSICKYIFGFGILCSQVFPSPCSSPKRRLSLVKA